MRTRQREREREENLEFMLLCCEDVKEIRMKRQKVNQVTSGKVRAVGERNKKYGYFCHPIGLNVFSPIFSPFWREEFLWAQVENAWAPHESFLSPPPNYTTHKFIFSPILSPKFFILPISPPNNHTLKDQNPLFLTVHDIGELLHKDVIYYDRSST